MELDGRIRRVQGSKPQLNATMTGIAARSRVRRRGHGRRCWSPRGDLATRLASRHARAVASLSISYTFMPAPAFRKNRHACELYL
jgi:hypothetical protein